MNSKYVLKIGAVLLVGFLCASPLSAQTAENASDRLAEEKRQLQFEDSRALVETEKESKKTEDFIFQYGGWVSAVNTHYKNLDNSKAVEDWVKEDYYIDIRAWVNAMFYQTVTFYARLEDYYIWRPEVASDYTGIGDDNKGPLVDSLYVNIDLTRKFNIPLAVITGRQFMTIGRGIAYANIHDAVQFKYRIGDKIFLKGFMSKTKPFEDNIDYSVPGYNKKGNNRHFYALEGSVSDGTTSFYSYALVQQDLTHAYPVNPTQNYTYNSQYIGIGLTGEPIRAFSYWAEGIKEFGSSNTDSRMSELAVKDVDAWAVDAGGQYRCDFYSHPVLEGEFAYGSGDKDRTRVTNTVGGNLSGRDTNFLYFGIFEAGYSLYPRLSNIFIYKAEVSLKPFEFIPLFSDRLAVGSKFYVYRKDQSAGGIYDIEATANKADIGQELDLFAHWKVYNNFFLALRYGVFFPGSAYPKGNRAASEYLYLRARLII